jgi:hypothetical protein
MRSKRECRPGVESLADRVVLSHVTPVASLVRVDTAHFHVATLTFKGSYSIQPAHGPNDSLRDVTFETEMPANIIGLGLVEMGGRVETHAPGLALPVHPLPFGTVKGSTISVDNFDFVGGNTTNPGLFLVQFGKKVAPVTKGFTFAYTFTISRASGEFAGASGGGKVEVKLVPKPPLSAKSPATTRYTGNCTVRYHFSPATVLT